MINLQKSSSKLQIKNINLSTLADNLLRLAQICNPAAEKALSDGQLMAGGVRTCLAIILRFTDFFSFLCQNCLNVSLFFNGI